MSKLTNEAKEYCKEVIFLMEREEIVQTLEGLAIACYDDESTEELVDSYIESVEAGDIEFDFTYASAMQYPHHVKMMNLDIDEVWQ